MSINKLINQLMKFLKIRNSDIQNFLGEKLNFDLYFTVNRQFG